MPRCFSTRAVCLIFKCLPLLLWRCWFLRVVSLLLVWKIFINIIITLIILRLIIIGIKSLPKVLIFRLLLIIWFTCLIPLSLILLYSWSSCIIRILSTIVAIIISGHGIYAIQTLLTLLTNLFLDHLVRFLFLHNFFLLKFLLQALQISLSILKIFASVIGDSNL